MIQSTVMTEAFKLSANERASRGLAKTFGNTNDEQQKCNQIAQQTGLAKNDKYLNRLGIFRYEN